MKFKVGDLVMLRDNTSIYLLLTEEIYDKFFKCIVFTEDIELGTLTGNTPFLILEKQKTILASLPLWIYGTENILAKYSDLIGKANLKNIPIKEFISYAENTPIPETPQGKYIKDVAKILAPINTSSLFEYLEKLEENTEDL
ncbi:MAG: hypothetical protein QW607_04740 [Desulfurococcaceae archaeon]